jgi:hypothetical protein
MQHPVLLSAKVSLSQRALEDLAGLLRVGVPAARRVVRRLPMLLAYPLATLRANVELLAGDLAMPQEDLLAAACAEPALLVLPPSRVESSLRCIEACLRASAEGGLAGERDVAAAAQAAARARPWLLLQKDGALKEALAALWGPGCRRGPVQEVEDVPTDAPEGLPVMVVVEKGAMRR